MLNGYSDADLAGDAKSRRSTSGVLVSFGSAPICWRSSLQKVVALSTTEAELVAAVETVREIVWLRKILESVGVENAKQIKLCVDNQSTIMIIQNPRSHSKIKHVDIKLKYVRERIKGNGIDVKYCESKNQKADMLTKPFSAGHLQNVLGEIMN